MYFLIYTSEAAVPFDEDSLKELLLRSREKNDKAGISGMLYFFDGIFIQLIEGEEAEVKQLAQTIAMDARHINFTIIKEGPIDNRYFREWSMGFKSVSADNSEEVKYFKELNPGSVDNSSTVMSLFKILLK